MPQSPYSTKFASGDIDLDYNPSVQMRRLKAEEKDTHSAPNILPFEFGPLPTYYANIIDNAMEACKILDSVLKEKEIKHKKQLLTLKQNTEKMLIYLIKNVDSILEKQTIGARHLGDEDETFDEFVDNP